MSYTHRLNSLRDQPRLWQERATTGERLEFLAAVEAVCDRSSTAMAPFNPRAMHDDSNRVVMQLSGGLVLVWADLVDAPEFFNVFYVGRLEL